MDEMMDVEEIFPNPPEVTKEQLEAAHKTGRYESIAFEEYKFVSQLVAIVARIRSDSKDFCTIPAQQYHILIGLMNRCARLMLGTMELSHKGKFGETAAIIFRCIIESGIKIIWLCTDPAQEKFSIYINDGLKPEIELKDIIQSNIEKNAAETSYLEKRMLESIDRHIKSAKTSEQEIRNSKRMPDMATLINSTGFNRTMYVAVQKLSSHNVHGTWPSLFTHYLEEDGEGFIPRGNDSSTHANEYLVTALIMTRAMYAYCELTLKAPTSNAFTNLLIATEKEILDIFNDMTQHGW